MKRFRREEEAREVEARKDELMRLAYEGVQATQSGSTLLEVTVTLESEIDRKAAWELSKEGRATIEGDPCSIPVNKLPTEIQRLLS